jgi:predicted Zn-dependent protease
MLTRRVFLGMLAMSSVTRAFATSAPARPSLVIQPLEPYDPAAIPIVRATLEEVFSYAVTINAPRPIPAHAKNELRGRYHAPTIAQTLGDALTLAITDADICQPGKHPTLGYPIPDWGVIGVAALGGPGGVISTHRIKDSRWLPYIVVHETGHLRGLDHCANERCQMLDVRGVGKKYLGMRYGWFCDQHDTHVPPAALVQGALLPSMKD